MILGQNASKTCFQLFSKIRSGPRPLFLIGSNEKTYAGRFRSLNTYLDKEQPSHTSSDNVCHVQDCDTILPENQPCGFSYEIKKCNDIIKKCNAAVYILPMIILPVK